MGIWRWYWSSSIVSRPRKFWPESHGVVLKPELREIVCRQMEEFANHAIACDVNMTHVKAHGAMYNMAATDLRIASVICETVAKFDPEILIFGLANSQWVIAAEGAGLRDC
jgi:UPF0271 protein